MGEESKLWLYTGKRRTQKHLCAILHLISSCTLSSSKYKAPLSPSSLYQSPLLLLLLLAHFVLLRLAPPLEAQIDLHQTHKTTCALLHLRRVSRLACSPTPPAHKAFRSDGPQKRCGCGEQ